MTHGRAQDLEGDPRLRNDRPGAIARLDLRKMPQVAHTTPDDGRPDRPVRRRSFRRLVCAHHVDDRRHPLSADQRDALSPTPAATTLAAVGHTIVFNTGGDCWCVPPPGGRVTDAWFGQHDALWLWVDGVDPGVTAGEPPFLGYGC